MKIPQRSMLKGYSCHCLPFNKHNRSCTTQTCLFMILKKYVCPFPLLFSYSSSSDKNTRKSLRCLHDWPTLYIVSDSDARY